MGPFQLSKLTRNRISTGIKELGDIRNIGFVKITREPLPYVGVPGLHVVPEPSQSSRKSTGKYVMKALNTSLSRQKH